MKAHLLNTGLLLTLLTLGSGIAYAQKTTGNQTFDSFNKVKKMLMTNVYTDHTYEFYCDNPFTKEKKLLSDTKKYTPKRNSKRAQSIEFEHIVPAEAFGQSFKEWREGHPDCVSKGKAFKGRNCAEKINMQYRYMQADMYNLVPAIGELNALRSNYTYAMISGEPREFGACDFELQDKKVEPRDQIRGDIARTYFYMSAAYPGKGIVSGKNDKLYAAWNKMDPIDQWECTRAKRIEELQKNENPFVKTPCQAKGWW